MKKRLTRRDQAAATRAALLEAARTVFLKSGYHGASVDAVAQEAGFTIGAVYSQFGGKAELFLALLEQRIAERGAQIRSLADQQPGDGDELALTRQWASILRTDLDWTLLVIEFRVHAARHPELAARFAEQHERLLRMVIQTVSDVLGPADPPPAARVEDFARLLLAMGPGAALARAAEGDAFRDDLLEEAAEAVAGRLLRPAPNKPNQKRKEQP